jgi:hypothetical protein
VLVVPWSIEAMYLGMDYFPFLTMTSMLAAW